MKKVILKKKEVDLANVDARKVYTFASNFQSKRVFKAHEIGDRWAFCDLGTSNHGAIGEHPSLKALIKAALIEGCEVLEFDGQDDLIKYLKTI